MAAASPILVTGATGNAGREVVASLRSRGATIRRAVREPEAVAARERGSECVRLDFRDPATFAPAVAGCDAMFLMRPPPIADTKRTLNVLVAAARDAGVRRIVFLSVAGAERNRWIPHHAVERCLQEGPRDWTILRPGFFAQNLASAYRDDIVARNRIYVPAGRGRVAFVDLRDVGVVAADALLDQSRHQACSYTLTGPRAFTFDEVADALSRVLGRDIDYVPAGILPYAVHLLRAGHELPRVVVQTVLHVGLRFGQAEAVDPTLERLLGREPHDVTDYIVDHADTWRLANRRHRARSEDLA